MILIRPTKVKEWLTSIEKDQNWLAAELKIGKAYLSQLLHNRCKISRNIIEHIIALSRIPFESLFVMTDEVDDRQFWGKSMGWRGKYMETPEYNALIQQIITDNPPKNGNHKKD